MVALAGGAMGPQRVDSVSWAVVDGATAGRLLGENGSADQSVVFVLMTGYFVYRGGRGPPCCPPEGPNAILLMDPETYEVGAHGVQSTPIDMSGIPNVRCIPTETIPLASPAPTEGAG